MNQHLSPQMNPALVALMHDRLLQEIDAATERVIDNMDAPAVQQALARVHAAAGWFLDQGMEYGYEHFRVLATAQRLDEMRAREAAELRREVGQFYPSDPEMGELYDALTEFLRAHRFEP